jgi:hypothetical protein
MTFHFGNFPSLAPRYGFKMLVLFLGLLCRATSPLVAQNATAVGSDSTNHLSGSVINTVTREPIARALVYTPDRRFAALTDDRGRFVLEFPLPAGPPSAAIPRASVASSTRAQPYRPGALIVLKPGFLRPNRGQGEIPINPQDNDVTLPLVPEAKIVGHVNLPGSDGSERVQVSLYQRQVFGGRAHWQQAASVSARSNGDFRFADLAPGSYKMFTHEILDRDPVTSDPHGQLYGYPPVYYPAAADFSSAAVIRLSASETFQVSLSPSRREYYPVKLSIANAPQNRGNVEVWAQGHPGPGYSLGHNIRDDTIEGSLPNGSYTVRVSGWGPTGYAGFGISNITVSGAPVSGPALVLVPNVSIPVIVREEFQQASPELKSANVGDPNAPDQPSRRRHDYLQVNLESDDDFNPNPGAEVIHLGAEDESLVVDNVMPGRYRVRVNTSIGFISSITSGGTDLSRQPLVVGLGAATPPIEITVRDDGATVEGTVDRKTTDARRSTEPPPGRSFGVVYFVPLPDSTGTFTVSWISPDGHFRIQQLPPGDYRVLAFENERSDLEFESEEIMRPYESQTQVLHIAAGQKEQLRVTFIPGDELVGAGSER